MQLIKYFAFCNIVLIELGAKPCCIRAVVQTQYRAKYKISSSYKIYYWLQKIDIAYMFMIQMYLSIYLTKMNFQQICRCVSISKLIIYL